DCQACVSVRVIVDEFRPRRTFRRILARNTGLRSSAEPARATDEQYTLLRRYLDARHAEGGMADMSRLDYVAMVEDTTIVTRLIEYRQPGEPGVPAPLVATALTDMLDDGLSMVYSFYDPAETSRSLGTWMVLDHIERARALGLPYVYLGYWVDGSRKMAYKTRFQPLEALTMEGWRRMETPPCNL
ncbi:MAG: arginyltransferase, partial [Parvibaculum sp.]|nr:arginyltransferase [Parvibaculum sp.]